MTWKQTFIAIKTKTYMLLIVQNDIKANSSYKYTNVIQMI